jgi:hypothetical protein
VMTFREVFCALCGLYKFSASLTCEKCGGKCREAYKYSPKDVARITGTTAAS